MFSEIHSVEGLGYSLVCWMIINIHAREALYHKKGDFSKFGLATVKMIFKIVLGSKAVIKLLIVTLPRM